MNRLFGIKDITERIEKPGINVCGDDKIPESKLNTPIDVILPHTE